MRSGLSILNGAALISTSIEKNNIAPNETQRIRPSFAKLLELVLLAPASAFRPLVGEGQLALICRHA
jgi:hypothetical protein